MKIDMQMRARGAKEKSRLEIAQVNGKKGWKSQVLRYSNAISERGKFD